MDKYEFNIKVEQIKKLVGKNDYDTAMKIADTIDWKPRRFFSRRLNAPLLGNVCFINWQSWRSKREILKRQKPIIKNLAIWPLTIPDSNCSAI